MARWAAGIEYDGSGYSGWQRLAHVVGVQQRVDEALSRVADGEIRVQASGRTDAGVHALQQVVHFDSEAQRSADAWRMGGNSHLPRDLALRWLQPVPEAFHARYSATGRHYAYVILCAAARSALWHRRCLWTPHRLDAARMQAAAQPLLGEHDFSAFRAAECQSPTAVRRVTAIGVETRGDFLVVHVSGNAFLHHMVRNIVGSLLLVGQGRQAVDWPGELLAGRDRRRAGPTAAAAGLYLLGPDYPADFGLPAVPELPFPR